MRLRHIESFHAVMTTGSMSAAARLLHVSQSAVSHTIHHAEQLLGFPLFHRSRGRLVPTSESQVLFREAKQVYENLERVKRSVRNLRQGGGGQLKVAAVPAICHELLPDVIAAFHQRQAGVWCEVLALHKQEMVNALLLGEIDIAVDFYDAAHPEIECQTLAETQLYAICRREAGAACLNGEEAALEQLADLPHVPLRGDDPIAQELAQVCRDRQIELRPTLEVQTSRLAVALVQRGLGWAVVDGFTAGNLDPALFAAARIAPAINCPVCALHARHRPPTVPARNFLRLLEQALERKTSEAARPKSAVRGKRGA